MQIDHVLYGVQDLAAATAWFDATFGLRAVSGGAHPEAGTANAILPVGNGQYVELIGVADRASEHPLALGLTALVQDGDRPVALCLRPDDLDTTAQRLGLEVTEATRDNPDGVTMRWRMAGLQAALGPDRLPFFIEWPGGGATPELDRVPATVGNGIDTVAFGGDADKLRDWIGDDLPAVTTVQGPPGILRFSVRLGRAALPRWIAA